MSDGKQNPQKLEETRAENLRIKVESGNLSPKDGLPHIADLKFTDLFDTDELQAVQDAFANATGVASIITDVDGVPITQPSNFCRLCIDIIRKTDKGLRNCYKSDAVLGRYNPDGPILQPCLSGGLWDGGASISVQGKHIANWLIGQVRNEDTVTEKMMDYAREIEADESAFREALEEVPIMPREKFESVGHALFLIANLMSQMAYQNAQLNIYQNRLERLVTSRTAELEKQKLKAESANRAKSVFLANMSHEIRTPMNAVLGYSQILARDIGLNESQRGSIEAINRAGEHLLTLIDSVLEMSKIEAGRIILDLAVFDFHDLLADLEMMFAVQTKKTGIDLIIERTAVVPQYIEADEGKVRQVLINLLGNAIKFTHQGSIRVTPAIADTRNGRVLLSVDVADTGIGIPDDEVATVFGAFEQAESGKSVAEGTGLGLAISRHYARLMGGDLVAVSRVDEGSTFTFTFEAQVAGEVASKKALDQRRVRGLADGQPPVRVLVVDDRDYNRDILVKFLKPLGFEVETADDGAQGVEAFKRFAPHIVLMDIRMPVMDGVTACRTIRNLAGGDEVVIIAVSASAMEEQRIAVLERGADSFLRKPVRETEIYTAFVEHAGVQFVYEEEETTDEVAAEPGGLATAALASLPRELLARIAQATETGNISALEDLSAQVGKANAALGAAFRALVDDFEYDQILTVVGPLVQGDKAID